MSALPTPDTAPGDAGPAGTAPGDLPTSGSRGSCPPATEPAPADPPAGDPEDRVAALYDRNVDRIYDFCVGMLRDGAVAASCVRDVFAEAATRPSEFEDADRVRPALYRIARTEVSERLRTADQEVSVEAGSEPPPGDGERAAWASRTELADLVADANGGLAEQDQVVLELAHHHGLAAEQLAEILEVTNSDASALASGMRATVERGLGALLLAREAHVDPRVCAELAAALRHWDGDFSELVRKRVSRHLNGCDGCDQRRRELLAAWSPPGTPRFLPAPEWLRDATLTHIAAADLAAGIPPSAVRRAGDEPVPGGRSPGADSATDARADDPSAADGPAGADADEADRVPAAPGPDRVRSGRGGLEAGLLRFRVALVGLVLAGGVGGLMALEAVTETPSAAPAVGPAPQPLTRLSDPNAGRSGTGAPASTTAVEAPRALTPVPRQPVARPVVRPVQPVPTRRPTSGTSSRPRPEPSRPSTSSSSSRSSSSDDDRRSSSSDDRRPSSSGSRSSSESRSR